VGSIQVLIVDDDEDTREIIAIALRSRHMDVDTAASAAEAMAHFQTCRPDVVVSDIGMPDEDGYALIRRIRRESEKPHRVAAIAYTGYAGRETLVQARSAGFDHCLVKPVAMEELVARILELTHGRDASAPSS
jgi:DNA-binding response OmpR family regulator